MANARRYVLRYMVGDCIGCWWSAITTIGLGLVFVLFREDALPFGVMDNPLAPWFSENSLLFGLCVLLCGLMALNALHECRRWAFLFATLCNMLIMVWLAVFFLVGEPASAVSVWAFFAFATLQAQLFVRRLHITNWG